tara:strand:- start:204 stop:392 length:189 start_codon:yes stop_codon:yes gene_type:complete
MRISANVPLPTVVANTDTSMKYIQENYFYFRTNEATERFDKGKKSSKKISRAVSLLITSKQQ